MFLNDDFVDGIERQTALDGILSRKFMSQTFSFLRSNDLIYTPAIKSYMLGEAPPAFDLLYWNGDGTNLPAKMAVEYLRGLCQSDGFAKGEFKVFGHPVSLADIKLPLCAIACETDHIAHWRGSFNGVKQMGSTDKTFILSRVRPYRRDHQPAVQGQVRPLHQRRPRRGRPRGLAEVGHLPQGQLVAALGGMAGGTVRPDDQGPRARRFAWPGTRNLCGRQPAAPTATDIPPAFRWVSRFATTSFAALQNNP